MSIELLLKPEEISVKNLVDIFILFCGAFGIERDGIERRRDEREFKRRWPEFQKDPRDYFEYRPYFGAKFFVQKIGERLQVWGYSEPEDLSYEKKEKRFRKALEDYFNILKI